MTNLTNAKTAADTALRAYEQIGRELPEAMEAWTPEQRKMMRDARNAYFAALTAYNALRDANGEA